MNSTDAIYHFEARKKSRRHALVISVAVVAPLVALAIIGNGWKAAVAVGEVTRSSRTTVVYKNQIHPSLGELGARVVAAERGGEANSDKELVTQRQSQEI